MAGTMTEAAPLKKGVRKADAFGLVADVEKLKDGSYSDFTISCHGREWKVHKFLLSARSSVLEKSCYGSFKVSLSYRSHARFTACASSRSLTSDVQESIDSKLNLSEYDESEVEALISYIYTCKYTVPVSVYEELPDESPFYEGAGALPFHLDMSIIADYFDMPGLVQLAKSLAINVLRTCNVEGLIEAAEMTRDASEQTSWILEHIAEETQSLIGPFDERAFRQFQIVAANPVLGSMMAVKERRARMSDSRGREGLVCGSMLCKALFMVDCDLETCRKGDAYIHDLTEEFSYTGCTYCGKGGRDGTTTMCRGWWPEDYDALRDGWMYGAEIEPGQDGRGWKSRLPASHGLRHS